MSDPRSRSRARRATGAFTLIELVLVVAIVATLSGLVVVLLHDVQSEASQAAALNEVNEVRRAVLQFRADTGFLPKQGPFNLEPAGKVKSPSSYPLLPGRPTGTIGDPEAWFRSPANLEQLLVRPELVAGAEALGRWDPNRRRGWRGPYLAFSTEGWVSMSATLTHDGAVDPWIEPVPAVADPFLHPADGELGFLWWSTTGTPVPPDRGHGRPILLLDLDDPNEARVVSAGPDGQFDRVEDNIVLYLLR